MFHKKINLVLTLTGLAIASSSLFAQQMPDKPGSALKRVTPPQAAAPIAAPAVESAPQVQNSRYIQPDFALNQVHPAMPASLAAKTREITPELVNSKKATTTYKRQVPAGMVNGGQVSVRPSRSAAEIQVETEKTRALQESLPKMMESHTDLITQQQQKAIAPAELPPELNLKTLPTTGR